MSGQSSHRWLLRALRWRVPQSDSERGARIAALLVVVACTAGAVQAARPLPAPPQGVRSGEDRLQSYDVAPATHEAPLHLLESRYALWAEPDSAVVTLTSPEGRIYTSMPLTVLAARSELPPGTRAHTMLDGHQLTTQMLARDGRVLEQAVVVPTAQSFTVSFTSSLGTQRAALPAFFSDGDRGIAMKTISQGYTPDPRSASSSPLPSVSTIGRSPFAPPPFDVQLRAAPGWFGLGLVQVPAATTMRLTRDGALTVDYPLARLGSQADLGAGPPVEGMVRFPDVLVTFAANPLDGLRAYHDQLAARHALDPASPPGRRPSWWSDPMADTWGEQMALGAERGSPHFGTAWVTQFAATFRRRYHLQHFTVVIDSRWQARIGDPLPDPVRFGGVRGMRALIDQLHAQGLHVLLWWPMWAHRIDHIPMNAKQARLAPPNRMIDPTLADFQSTMAGTVADMLGAAPGQLHADGFKLDWQYDIPDGLAHPATAWGALALYRYMDAIHGAAHTVRGDAMVDASAVAPQFSAVADTVRLYDAWSTAEWDRRAAMVAAVAPEMLIDGDGWQAGAGDMVSHTVSSAVFGVPAVYFASTWTGGAAIPAAVTDELGTVLSLSALKGQGRAAPLAGGEWQYVAGGMTTARTFAHERALVVRAPSCGATWTARATSAVYGRLVVPMTGGRLLGVVDGSGHRTGATPVVGGVLLTMQPGRVYVLSFAGGC